MAFEELVTEIESQGFDLATAAYYAMLIGDTPVQDEDGWILVRDEQGKQLARLALNCFKDN